MSAEPSFLHFISTILSNTSNNHSPTHLSLLNIAPLAVVTPQLLHLLHTHRLLQVENVPCEYTYHNGNKCDKMLELQESDVYISDGYELRCPTHSGSIFIRRRSWFAGRCLGISQMLYILHLLQAGASVTTIVNFFKEAKLYRETVVSLLNQLQEKMVVVLHDKYVPTFDPSDEIEIDEMWMDWEQPDERVGPKERLIKWKKGQWVIGLINRSRTKLWIECIPDRKRNTIQQVVDPLLKAWLLRYPRVYTDALKSYEYLSKENTHYVINKAKEGFSIKETTFWGKQVNINVNKIENLWMHLRRHLSKRHTYCAPKKAHLHIAEFMYNFHKLDWFDLIKFP